MESESCRCDDTISWRQDNKDNSCGLCARIHVKTSSRVDKSWILETVSTIWVCADIKQGHPGLLSLGLVLICDTAFAKDSSVNENSFMTIPYSVLLHLGHFIFACIYIVKHY